MSGCRKFLGLLVLAIVFHLHSQLDWRPEWMLHNMCILNCSGKEIRICQEVWHFNISGSCRALPANQSFRMEVLLAHNEARENVTNGRTKLPPAANMQVLDYDLQLEYVSQRFANICRSNYTHCDKWGIQERVGQNVAVLDLVNGQHPPMADVVRLWMQEQSSVTPAVIRRFPENASSKFGNFTQLAWANSSFVGCGRSMDDKAKKIFIFCTYWPMGNVVNESVYKIGRPCSGCKFCNSRFKGMCGVIFQFPKGSGASAAFSSLVVLMAAVPVFLFFRYYVVRDNT